MYDVYSCVFQQCWTINAEDNKCMAVSLALSDANVSSYAPSPADFSFARPGPGFSQIHDNTLKTFSALRVLILRILLSSHNRKRWIWKCYGKRKKKMNETRKQGNRKTWTKIKMRASRKLRFTPLIDTLSWRKPNKYTIMPFVARCSFARHICEKRPPAVCGSGAWMMQRTKQPMQKRHTQQ